MAINLSGDPADIAQLLRSMGGNNNGGGNANGSGGGGTSGGNTNGSAANTNSAGSGGSGTSGGNTSGTNSNSSGSGGNSGGANSGGNANSGGTNSSSSSGSGSGTGNTVATNGSGGGGGTNSGGGGGGTNSGGGGGQPKPTPTTSTPTTPAPTPAAPTPTTGERVLSAVGLPKEELGKLKTEPLQGVKGLYKAQWMVAPNALGAAVAAPAVFKAGAEAAKQSGATDATIKAAKDAARLAASHGGKAMVAKGIGHMIPFIGSGIAALSAIDDFRNGRIVSGALNVLGIIPGPVGWTAMAAAAIWNAFGEDGIGKWDQPNGTDTWMLPASAKDISGVKELDAKIREAQNSVFRFEDGPKGTVWNSNAPAAIRIDGKGAATGSVVGVGLGVLDKVTGTAGTDDIKALATSFFNGLSDHFAAIDKVLQTSGEPYFLEQRAALQPQLAAMAKLREAVEPLMAQLGAASDGATVRYQAVLDTNQAARKQLSEEGKLSDSGAAATMQTNLATGASAISAANDKLAQLCAETPPAVVAARTGTAPTGTRPAETKPQETKPVAPVATPPAVTTSPQTPATPKQETKTDDLAKLLSQLGKQNTPTAANPLSSTGSGLGGGSPLGSQGLGGGQGGGTPLAQSKPDTSAKDEPKKLVDSSSRPERKTAEKKLDDTKSLSTPKPEQQKSTVPAAEKPSVPAAAPVATPAPPAGPTPAQQNAVHAAAQAQEPSKEVDVKGNKTTFPDAKTAAMAKTLAAADPTHPVSLADAAAKAGLTPPTPGQDPGTQVAPTDAKPGDILVAGNKNYMLLGDGKFYDLNDYKVVGASDIPQQLGERAGYFHLNDPNPGQAPGAPAGQGVPAAPQGPVSPQSTQGVAFQVPGATGTPQGPVDAGAPPAAAGGVPVAGTPGVPKPGVPGSGPANAASTDTGVGQGLPSAEPGRLDPAAVR